MNNDAIVTPILKAINDLRDEVRENRRKIEKNSEALNNFKDETNKHFEKLEKETKRIEFKADKRWQIYQQQVPQERKYIEEILEKFQTSVENMYGENKTRIDNLEEKLDIVRT